MDLFARLQLKDIILGSASPRRQYLLEKLDIPFRVLTRNISEDYPENLVREEISLFLAEKKAEAFKDEVLQANSILITADTIVWLDDHVLDKPAGHEQASETLLALSGRKHQVITGVCLRDKQKKKSFSVSTDVYFKSLNKNEINYYIEHYKPYDKAGAYGIQEWIGYMGIERIDGSFYNVMGLPVKALYDELLIFL
jgi:septum formation protein